MSAELKWAHRGQDVPTIMSADPLPRPSRSRIEPAYGMVVHSGDKHPHVANYVIACVQPEDYHYAPFVDRTEGRIQMRRLCPLDRRAYHAAEFNHLVGVALTGPWDQPERSPFEIDALRAVATEVMGNKTLSHPLRFWVRHSDVHPQRRRDPGPGLPDDWSDDMGIIYLRAHLSRAGWESAIISLQFPQSRWRASARWLRELGWEDLGR